MPAFQVIAHRGASVAERENTIAAFRAAATMGAHAVELDVRRTADGAMAVHHDDHLGDGRLLCEMPSAHLPDHIPLLAEALDACEGMWVNIEIKNHPRDPDHDPQETMAAAVAGLLDARDEDHRWVVSSFSRNTIDALRAVRPGVRTAHLVVSVADDRADDYARALAADGHFACHPWVETLTESFVSTCHRHGLQVNPWTCDDPARMAEISAWGVDGIVTNVPDVALRV